MSRPKNVSTILQVFWGVVDQMPSEHESYELVLAMGYLKVFVEAVLQEQEGGGAEHVASPKRVGRPESVIAQTMHFLVEDPIRNIFGGLHSIAISAGTFTWTAGKAT